ncbi:CRISPR-associated helicase Cas3' [Pseudomonas fluorescens]|nr:CRISPR-associated helicase Cas3' [Pseudomonas fluorescens]
MFSSPSRRHSGAFPVVPFARCPAKTFMVGEKVLAGRTVENHCRIVGEVAKELIGRYPKALSGLLFPAGAAMAAAAHDIGKVSPYFIEKLRRACTDGVAGIPELSAVNPQDENDWGGHAGVSQLAAAAAGAPAFVPEILGQHHGFSPVLTGRLADDPVFGGAEWQRQRLVLIQALKDQMGMGWPDIPSEAIARVVAGLASVSDWIGSGPLFENPASPWEGSIARAVDEAGFVMSTFIPDMSFSDVFKNYSANATQAKLVEQVTGPGVYVLEGPMGIGKTEAALYCAYRMLASGQATGIYFGLPTQLTSNKIYDRFTPFLERILVPGSAPRTHLLHGRAWLMEHLQMGEEGKPGGSWFDHRKRGLLAPFGVGTIDQALMACMNVRHGFVRTFGLAGKVVILDEVHTYDSYTGTILEALVGMLRSVQCTVIILSATLSIDRRRALLGDGTSADAYPLITAAPYAGELAEFPVEPGTAKTTKLRLLNDQQEAFAEALERARMGQQVMWVENTVGDAQERFLEFSQHATVLDIECGLLHSCFTHQDRQTNETYWVSQFSKAGWPTRTAKGRILVGTQVLEQSLDIDADFLVSRFAPTDMLLQRLGRLWRHGRKTPRSPSAVREAWLLAPNLESALRNASEAFGLSAAIYSSYVLCRSLECWQSLQSITLPSDIRPLIETTYASRQEHGQFDLLLKELDEGTRDHKGRKALRQLACLALATDGKTLPEEKAETRYSDTPSVEVLLVRDAQSGPERNSNLTLRNGKVLTIPRSRSAMTVEQWRALSTELMREVVSVPASRAPRAQSVEALTALGLHHCFFLGTAESKEALLRVAILDNSGGITLPSGGPGHKTLSLSYQPTLGYRTLRLK